MPRLEERRTKQTAPTLKNKKEPVGKISKTRLINNFILGDV
jgi:hypothetical protein